MIVEKCVFCDQYYKSTIDKAIDICPKCENSVYEDSYDQIDQTELKHMIMTYSDKILGENKWINNKHL